MRNFSRKRMAILNTLQETTLHPTADWVYARLKPRYPDLSLGTVYRNLKKSSVKQERRSAWGLSMDGTFRCPRRTPCPSGLQAALYWISPRSFSAGKSWKSLGLFHIRLESARVVLRGSVPPV